MGFIVYCNYSFFEIPLQQRLLQHRNQSCELQCRFVDWFLCGMDSMLQGIFKQPLIQFPHHWFRVSMIDNFALNSVLVFDVSVTVHCHCTFQDIFCFMSVALLFVLFALCKCCIFILRLDFSNNIERCLYIVKRSKLIICSC